MSDSLDSLAMATTQQQEWMNKEQANMATLTGTNAELAAEIKAVRKRIATLEEENARLKQQISGSPGGGAAKTEETASTEGGLPMEMNS